MLTLNKTRWKIIEELSKSNKTPTELSKKLKITLPSIHAQLKELENKKLVKKTGEIKGKTRPYAEYSIEDGFIYFIKALPGEAEQKFLEINEDIKLQLKIWSIPQKEYHTPIERFLWKVEERMGDIESVIIYGSVASGKAKEGSDIDILLLVKKDIKRYEKEFSAASYGKEGEEKVVMAQVFKTEDFENSLKKGSDFAAEVIKSSIILYDPNNAFSKLKR